MNRKPNTGGGAGASVFGEDDVGLDRDKNIDQMCKSQPHDCRLRTTSGSCFLGTDSHGYAVVVHAYCNRLMCRTCSRRICNALLASITAAITSRGLRHHVVLTLPPATGRHEAEPLMKSALRKFLLALKYRHGRVHYVWALGAHKSRALHLHLLLSAAADRSWLKRKWRLLTGATQVSCREFPESDAWNLARYLVLNMMSTVVAGMPLSRRYGCSRNITLRPKPPRDGTCKWERLQRPSSAYAREQGLDPHPISNGSYVLAPADALASQPRSRCEVPLDGGAPLARLQSPPAPEQARRPMTGGEQ